MTTHSLGINVGPNEEWRTLVEQDGTVLVWDPIADHYTSVHSLPPDLVEEARTKAALVRAGSHLVAAGHVYPARAQQ